MIVKLDDNSLTFLILTLLAPTYDVFNNGDSWNLAFRGTQGAQASAYDAYMNSQSGGTCIDKSCLDVRYSCSDLAKNKILKLLYCRNCPLSNLILAVMKIN